MAGAGAAKQTSSKGPRSEAAPCRFDALFFGEQEHIECAAMLSRLHELSLVLAVSALCAGAPVGAEDLAGGTATETGQHDAGSKTELVFEADAYYSNIGVNVSLTDKPIPIVTSDDEAVMYRELIKGSLVPRYMLLEASVYPLPWLFTYVKSDMPELYRQGEIGNSGINLFESATAGFQEPWAVSAFFGNMARLERPGERRETDNWGYTGYLVSWGNQHIKDNTLIADDWFEVEWKIKGKRAYEDERLSWSFRVGAKFNANREVNDVTYVGLHRSKLDIDASFLGWLDNANYDLRIHSLQDGGEIVRVELIAGKNIPMPSLGFTPTLDIGAVWTSPNEYAGALRDTHGNALTLVFRPSLAF